MEDGRDEGSSRAWRGTSKERISNAECAENSILLAADGSGAVSIYCTLQHLGSGQPLQGGRVAAFDRNRSVRTSVLACVSGCVGGVQLQLQVQLGWLE